MRHAVKRFLEVKIDNITLGTVAIIEGTEYIAEKDQRLLGCGVMLTETKLKMV